MSANGPEGLGMGDLEGKVPCKGGRYQTKSDPLLGGVLRPYLGRTDALDIAYKGTLPCASQLPPLKEHNHVDPYGRNSEEAPNWDVPSLEHRLPVCP